MFQASQNDEYLQRCIDRAKTTCLDWCEQFLDLVAKECPDIISSHYSINDIGCNLGQFFKSLKKRNWSLDYRGYDIEKLYLDEAKKIFPELSVRLFELDITQQAPKEADISVVSATLEHLDFLSPGLDNILQSTRKLVVLRTFLGESGNKAIRMTPGAKTYYYVNQYSFCDVMSLFESHGFNAEIVRDRYTDSMPRYLNNGLVRTQYVVIGRKL